MGVGPAAGGFGAGAAKHPLEECPVPVQRRIAQALLDGLPYGAWKDENRSVRASGDDRARVMEIAEVFRVNIVDVTASTLTLEATGKPDKLEALLSLLDDFGIVELSRTGRIALGRGDRGIKERVLRAAND